MKTVQFFLSNTGVEEVMSKTGTDFECTCEGFQARKKCKHVTWCESKVTKAGFPVKLIRYAKKEDVALSKSSEEEFRKFLLKYGKIEAI